MDQRLVSRRCSFRIDRWQLGSLVRIPIVRGLPFGHDAAKFTLPFGAPGRLAVASGTAVLTFSGHPRPKTP